MSNAKMFVPKTIRVGYNSRSDTYTGKLAYVIYIDDKNKVRKELSWTNWRQEELGSDDFKNEPTSGFVLNKKAGGDRWSWNTRRTYSRVYDPRGFEFEITIENLLWILQECDCSKGKGLEGEFVYSWSGKDLVLLPCGSPEYKECMNFTNLTLQKIGVKDLTDGCTYIDKNKNEFIYMGKFLYGSGSDYISRSISEESVKKKKHVFKRVNSKNSWGEKFIGLSTLSTLKQKITTTPVANYAFIIDEYLKSKYAKRLIFFRKVPVTEQFLDQLSHYRYSRDRNNEVFDYNNTKFFIQRSDYNGKDYVLLNSRKDYYSHYGSDKRKKYTYDELKKNYRILHKVTEKITQ